MIKFGDIDYFVLLDLQTKLKAWKYNKLGLLTLDKLRLEVDSLVEAIHLEDNERRKNEKNN
jgi:hypothetical protein